jgi:secretion/DNA translocation related TadE-like protein
VVAAGVMTVLLVLTVAGTVVGSAVIARHRAQAVADLAALAAAAQVASGPQAACASAVALATAAGAAVSSCTVEELDVVVGVEVPVGLGRWGLHAARAKARAGPVG